MGDDYRVIAKAVRGPMRRWWLRVGIWWIGLIVLILLGEFAAICYISAYGYGNGVLPPGILPFVDWLDFAWRLMPLLVGLVWILASLNVFKALKELTADSLVAFGNPAATMIRFRLIMVQAFWPIGLLAMSWILSYLRLTASACPGLHWYAADFLTSLNSAGQVIDDLIPIMWIAALLAISPGSRLVTWLWWIACFAARTMESVLYSGLLWQDYPNLFSQLTGSYYDIQLPIQVPVYLVGISLIALSMLLLGTQHKAGRRLGMAIGIIGILIRLNIGLAPLQAMLPSGLREMTEKTVASYSYFAAWQPVVSSEVFGDGDLYSILICWPGYWPSFNTSIWWSWLPLAINACIAIGYYWLIRGVLFLGVSRRPTAS